MGIQDACQSVKVTGVVKQEQWKEKPLFWEGLNIFQCCTIASSWVSTEEH